MPGFVSGLLELLAPTRCSGCELPGVLLCERCREDLSVIDPEFHCPRCGAPFGKLICTECWNRSLSFEETICIGTFESALARSVVLHKDSNERRLAGVFAELLEERISAAWPGWPETVTWVPSSREAVTRRGFDHAEALGRELAQRLGVPAARALERGEAADQRRLDRKQRAANVRGTFTRSQTPLSGRIVLVDDVVTTCATSDAAASMLLESGAEAVRLAGVARTW